VLSRRGAYDVIVIGASGARLAALKSGAIDATMLVPARQFRGAEARLQQHWIGLVRDYAGARGAPACAGGPRASSFAMALR